MPPAEYLLGKTKTAPQPRPGARIFRRAKGLFTGSNLDQRPLRTRRFLKPRVSIYVLVLAMVAALTAPAVGLLIYIVDQENQERQQRVSIRGSKLAGEIADRFDQEIAALRTILAVFASSGWLETNELSLLHRRARSALAGTDRHLMVLDGRDRQLLNTRVDFGVALGRQIELGTAADALGAGTSFVSDVVYDQFADTHVFNVLRPVELPDGRRRVLVLSRNTDKVSELVGSVLGEVNWSFAILDSSGRVATKVISPGEADATVPDACRDGVMGFRTWGPPEEKQYGFVRLVNGASWHVCTWVAAEHVLAQADDLWTTLRTGTMAWLGAALVAALLLSAAVSRSIVSTARIGEALGAGREIPISGSFIAEIDQVRRSLAEAAAERIRKEQRLQLVLRETAHRAKNQLALAASLVDLSSRSASSTTDLKEDLTGRLLALGRSLDAMTHDHHGVALLDQLIRTQLAPFTDDAGDRLQISGPEVTVSERAAQSLSLVLHELATNAAKYGAWSQAGGKIEIEWEVAEGDLRLSWIERGVSPVSSEGQGFGTVLVDALIVKTMRGILDREIGGSGLVCRIRIPLVAIMPST